MDIVAGLVIALGYDFFNTLRHRLTPKKLGAICDVLFWLFAGTVILGVLFYTTDMELRSYAFFGILTGVFFYFTALSYLLQPFLKKLTDVFYFFWKILFTIARFFAIIIKNGLLFLWIPFRWLGRLFRKLLAKPVRAFREHKKRIKRI